jgi:hypothetical protein
MDTVRGRFGSVLEWLVAAAFLAATLTVASLIVKELRATRTPPPLPAQASALVPRAIPSRAVSVPVLPFPDGKQVRVGDTFAGVAAILGRSAESGRQEVDRGPIGERLSRFYEHAGTRFVLVFEPFERNGEARVTGIYVE